SALPRRAMPWRWLLAASALCATMGAAAVGAFLWLLSVPTATDCQRLSSLSPDIDRLHCSQAAAASGDVEDLLAGLDLMAGWPETHPLHGEAQRWMGDWSSDILNIAHQAVREGDLARGRQLSQRIPVSSPSYDEAVAVIAGWDAAWAWGDGLLAQADAALQSSNWGEVSYVIQALRQSEYRYWRVDQPKALTARMAQEKAAQRHRVQALQLAEAGTVEGWRKAIAAAQQIDSQTFVWSQLQPSLNQWGERLLEQGRQHWYAMRLDEAIAISATVADIPTLAVDAYDLAILSRARRRATATVTNWEPTVSHLWDLNRAIATTKAITPDSRFYPQAAASIASWEMQLQDLGQLYQAQLAADGGQIPAFQMAIARASAVEGGHLRRLQAQTLTAHWQREVERIEDTPRLQEARQIAASGAVDALQSAIARASQIQPNRALHAEAQQAVARWTGQIQTIQDRPILDQARRYASQGQLSQAIARAGAVGSGRALTSEARGLQQRWRAQLDAAARPETSARPTTPANDADSRRQPQLGNAASEQLPRPEARSRRSSTQNIQIPALVPAPSPANSADEPLFNQQAPSSAYPVNAPPPVPASAAPFSEIFGEDLGQGAAGQGSVPQQDNAAPSTISSPNPMPPSESPTNSAPSTGIVPGAGAVPLSPRPSVNESQSASPEPLSRSGLLLEPVSQQPTGRPQTQQQSSLWNRPDAAIAVAVAAAHPNAPETIALPPEVVLSPAESYFEDATAFPLLYAGPLFAL
ncbi:MAG: hypothetical protein WBA10_11145, partial [Elainellaceae cyanobacterium]